MQLLEQFLKALDLFEHVNEIEKNRRRYDYTLGTIDFVFLKMVSEKEFFEVHSEVWCENKTEFFVTIFGDGLIHICDSKTRPYIENPVKTASIDSFRYGENTAKAQKYMRLLTKESIDAGDCLREIRKKFQNRLRVTVDKDLLENLEKRRGAIISLLGERENKKEIAQKIIDRCLFIRFLEDRAGRNDLKKVLSVRRRPKDLAQLFDFYNGLLNGDIFKKRDIPEDIDPRIMNELDSIFGETYTYITFQKTLVPYNFEKIPIILISNIYEKFLAEGKEKEGIVFTPENVVEYTINKILADKRIIEEIENGNISILDPACGSGVFLVKFLEKIIQIKEKAKIRKLSLDEKADIVKNCLYGIDKNNDALRIAALSLYLKIIENETPEIINEKLFRSNGQHFMFPGLRENRNLVEGDSLFDPIFDQKRFDVIVGNPPWGYEFRDWQKKSIDKRWAEVSKYQSSQCFLLAIKKWMEKKTICGMVVNLSNFTSSISKRFRKCFIDRYSLKLFINLSKIKDIAFGSGSEPACILIFDNMPSGDVEFITPDLSQFSLLTYAITDGYTSRISLHELIKDDNLWHVYALGFDMYIDLIELLDSNKPILNDFQKRFEVGIMKYRQRRDLSREEFYKKYGASSRISDAYYPIVDSLKDVERYRGAPTRYYLMYGSHLDRPRNIALFKGEKLIITRSWPIKTFFESNTKLFDGNFFIFQLKNEYASRYLQLFEAILNSKLAQFYLGVKYLLRGEGNYSKVNLEHLKQFPIPSIENKQKITDSIIEKVKLLEASASYNISTITGVEDEIDDLVYELYDLDHYAVKQIEHYIRLAKMEKIGFVTPEEVQKYCQEFIETFQPLIREGLFINADENISDFIGAMVKFTVSTSKRPFNQDNAELERFIPVIEKHEIEGYNRERFFKEEKIKFYDDNKLYMYKSNKPKDWTRFVAIKDANEEIELFFQTLRNM